MKFPWNITKHNIWSHLCCDSKEFCSDSTLAWDHWPSCFQHLSECWDGTRGMAPGVSECVGGSAVQWSRSDGLIGQGKANYSGNWVWRDAVSSSERMWFAADHGNTTGLHSVFTIHRNKESLSPNIWRTISRPVLFSNCSANSSNGGSPINNISRQEKMKKVPWKKKKKRFFTDDFYSSAVA